MVSRILAFRPASVVERLGPRNDACPLSLRDLLGPALELGLVLPVVRAPIAAIARAALVAAKEARSAIGLALPPGVRPEPWFDAVTRAADEYAAGLPIFLSGEVTVEGEGASEVERAFREAWRLVDGGLTHLAIDVGPVAAPERGRVLAEIAEAGAERGICIDCIVPLEEGAASVRRAAALFEDLAARGASPDVASVRCPAPASVEEARAQVGALARICQALAGVPVMRRGAISSALLPLLAGSPVKACEDGGAAAASAIGSVRWDVIAAGGEEESRRTRLERAAGELSEDAAERLEARAYVEVLDLIEALGAGGSARTLARALERRLEER